MYICVHEYMSACAYAYLCMYVCEGLIQGSTPHGRFQEALGVENEAELGGPAAGTRVSTLLGAVFPLGDGLEKQQEVNGEGLRVTERLALYWD